MATMKDVARLAGVSTSTVSHVINQDRFVTEKTRAKVLQVVRELNYTPSALARSLKVKQTKTIGMLVTATNNPFFTEVMSGVEQYCQQNQYNLIITSTQGDNARLEQNLQTLLQKQVDGLLLMCGDSRLNAQVSLDFKLPVVVLDWWFNELQGDKIIEDSQLGGYLATKALLEAGHRDIGIITGNLQKSLAHGRLLGFRQALQEVGIVENPQWVLPSHFDFAGGLAAMRQLLALAKRPSAVFCCSDSIAVGAYQALWEQGLRVPEDMSLIGYDDIELAAYLTPPLSTINQPKAQLGQLAVQTLLARIQDPQKAPQTLVLAPKIVMRNSIKRLV